MFVSREKELAQLEKLYAKDKFQMIVMYGRRRIGKTTLINEFMNSKPAIFFSAQEANDQLNLEIFSTKVYDFFGLPTEAGAFNNWNDALMFIAKQAMTKQFILAIDEFPYIAETNKSIKSILQNIIDHELLQGKLYLILCGSQIGFMEHEVLGYKSPLFGRRTAQFKIEGFDYIDASKMLGNCSDEEKIHYYACIGGTPHYLAQVDIKESFIDNMKELYFSPQGYLYSEPTMLLQQELREPAMYNTIIMAIATGSSRLNEICTKINEDSSKTIKYIKTLIDMKILYKEHPFGENPERSKKSIYKISDNCFAFWYRYVFMNKTGIEIGMGDDIVDNLVIPELTTFIGKPVFEDVCMQYLIRLNLQKKLPFMATDFGTWWGNDKFKKENADIDIVVGNKSTKQIILCECKWKNELVGQSDIIKLLEKDHLLAGYQEYFYIFFSKSGYTKNAIALMKQHTNLKLITLPELFQV